jgi:hypothetical protein
MVSLDNIVCQGTSLAVERTNTYSEYTFPVVDGSGPTIASFTRIWHSSVGTQDAMRRCNLVQTIRWELYPLVTEEPHTHAWLEIQAMLGLAKNTIHAYGRGANDYLEFCQRTSCPLVEATKADNAVRAVLPDVPHQLCHFHYLKEAAKPVYEADKHAKKELKKHLRGVRPIERAVEKRKDVESGSDSWLLPGGA